MFQFSKNIHFETRNEGKPIFTVSRTAVSTTCTAATPPAPVRWQSCPLVHNNNIHRRFARACEWIYGIIHHIILVIFNRFDIWTGWKFSFSVLMNKKSCCSEICGCYWHKFLHNLYIKMNFSMKIHHVNRVYFDYQIVRCYDQ